MKQVKLIVAAIALSFPLQVLAISDQKIDAMAQQFMRANHVDTMSIAVVDKGNTRIFNYGRATSRTIYPIASFTKTFTATLAAVASVEGKMDLNAPFTRYFPGLNNNANLEQITATQLLAHVSTFPFDFDPRPTTYSAAINGLNQYQMQGKPGTEYQYSNAGIGTVGYMLENVYGQSYQTILSNEVLKPLDMTSTYLIIPHDKLKRLALGHGADDKIEVFDKTMPPWFAAASLKSTIADMAKYLSAQINYATLDDATLSKAIALVHKNVYCFDDKKTCEQLAWQAHAISELNTDKGDSGFIGFDSHQKPMFVRQKVTAKQSLGSSRIFIDKTGAGYGMSSYMAYIPDQKKGIVILANKFLGDERIKLGRDILKAS